MVPQRTCLSGSRSYLKWFSVLALAFSVSVAAQPQSIDADRPLSGVISVDQVRVYSRPGEQFAAVGRLERGDAVTVVGSHGDEWLKILPPEGVACLVSEAHVELRGDGTIGEVSHASTLRFDTLVQSTSNTVAAQVSPGDRLSVLGRKNSLFRVVPPDGVVVYVSQSAAVPAEPAPIESEPMNDEPIVVDDARPTDDAVADVEETVVEANEAALERFAAAESLFDSAEDAELSDQPLERMRDAYAEAIELGLNPAQEQVAATKLELIDARIEARQEAIAHAARQQEIEQEVKVLRVEREELQERIEEMSVDIYVAVGTVRASSLQRGQGKLFRLTDPATERTVAYLQDTNERRFNELMGQFVGVRGTVRTDPVNRLRTVIVESAEPVDPTQIGEKVVSQIVPPSLYTTPAPDADASAAAE